MHGVAAPRAAVSCSAHEPLQAADRACIGREDKPYITRPVVDSGGVVRRGQCLGWNTRATHRPGRLQCSPISAGQWRARSLEQAGV